MPRRVIVKLPRDGDLELIRRCADADAERQGLTDAAPVIVKPLGRFGYTSSRLYRVTFDQGRYSRPFVLKTAEPWTVQYEANAVYAYRAYFPELREADVFPDTGQPEAIIYPLVNHGTQRDGREIRELKDELYRRGERGWRNPAKLLAALYEGDQLPRADMTPDDGSDDFNPRVDQFQYGAEYKWYLREDHQTLPDPLSDIFGTQGTRHRANGMGLKDPRRILPAVKALKYRSLLAPVHGDLHPSNVLIDSRGFPALIDFAFAHAPAHYVKDFVLMECSIRFAMAPRLLPTDLMEKVDTALLRQSGYTTVRALAKGVPFAPALQEMAALVEVIRQHCASRYPRFKWKEYLLSLYLILIGVIRLELYQDTRVLRALCRLADYLETKLGSYGS